MYKTILVPHSGTEESDKALKHAIHAADNTSKIILLHIVETISYPSSFALAHSERKLLIKSIDVANNELREGMMKELEKKIQQCREHNIKSEIKVEIGDAAQIIFNTIDKEHVDLVVIARRRKSKIMRKLTSLGSVSRKVVENAPCPVLLIEV